MARQQKTMMISAISKHLYEIDEDEEIHIEPEKQSITFEKFNTNNKRMTMVREISIQRDELSPVSTTRRLKSRQMTVDNTMMNF